MVTHFPSSNSNTSSLPLSSPTLSTYQPGYPSSQAESSSARYSHHVRDPQPSSRFSTNIHHHRAPSTASNSSQTTLVARSALGYPSAPPSSYGRAISNSSHRQPSVASTSEARQVSSHRHRSSSTSRSRREVRRENDTVSLNNFPYFGQTGDVEIRIDDYRGRYAKVYRLHGLILAQNSKWFANDLAMMKADQLGANFGSPYTSINVITNGSGQIWHYELDWSCMREQTDATPLLVRRSPPQSQASFAHLSGPAPPSIGSRPQVPCNSFHRSLASDACNGTQIHPSEDAELLTVYDNLFLIFYNHSPNLSKSNIATAYIESKLLLSLASAYSALSVVGPRIDHHLLQFGSRLWKQIAKYPPSYLKLGHLARSKPIFSEALVHVVGQWPVGQPQLRRGIVDDAMIDLVEDKVDELEDMKLRVEAKLFRISLTTGRGERVVPNNAYLDWLALSLFRQWIADNTAQPSPVILKDPLPVHAGRSTSGREATDASSKAGTSNQHGRTANRVQPQTSTKLVRTYRLLNLGGQAYLPHDDLKRFLKLRPGEYSRDTLRRFERRIEELKYIAKNTMRPLTRSCLELDCIRTESAGGSSAPSHLQYLTCSRCEEREFAHIWKQ